jgi:hypothetical protein
MKDDSPLESCDIREQLMVRTTSLPLPLQHVYECYRFPLQHVYECYRSKPPPKTADTIDALRDELGGIWC